jgi:hypothetical protein
MRRSLLAAALVSLAAAVPASAVQPTPPTECAAVLVAPKASADPARCSTLGNPGVPGAGDARQLRLTVLTGSAVATMTCNNSTPSSVTVTMDGSGTGSKTVTGGGYCWVEVTATSDLTTAVATDTSAYIFS